MVKIVKFDPNLSTLEGANMPRKLTQDHLDNIIRLQAVPNAVAEMVSETITNQEYKLSNGTFLIISKRTGKGRIETAWGTLVRRF